MQTNLTLAGVRFWNLVVHVDGDHARTKPLCQLPCLGLSPRLNPPLLFVPTFVHSSPPPTHHTSTTPHLDHRKRSEDVRKLFVDAPRGLLCPCGIHRCFEHRGLLCSRLRGRLHGLCWIPVWLLRTVSALLTFNLPPLYSLSLFTDYMRCIRFLSLSLFRFLIYFSPRAVGGRERKERRARQEKTDADFFLSSYARDVKRVCASSDFKTVFVHCVQTSCSPTDAATGEAFLNAVCSAPAEHPQVTLARRQDGTSRFLFLPSCRPSSSCLSP